jgi:DNA modification methylase
MELQTDVTGASMHPIVHQPLPLDRIICGDNCEVMRTLPSESIDLVVTSPPYDDIRTYGGHLWDFYGVAWNLKRLLKPGGVIVWVVGDATKDGSETLTSCMQAKYFKDMGLNVHDTMIYEKANTGGARGSNLAYWQAFEFMFVFSKGQPKATNLLEDRKNAKGGMTYTTGGRRNADGTTEENKRMTLAAYGRRTNVWRISTADVGGLHPAPFPEALARDHILSWSNEGDVVLDPFSGSGTTAKMAKHNGRRFIGIEVNPEYVAISEKRLLQQVLF